MSDDWDFYLLLVDSEPASIYVNLALARNAPLRTQPHMAYVRIYMRQPREDGLSSNEEFDELSALEDALEEAASGAGATTYAGRNTSSGNRDFYFYTSDTARFSAAAETAMASHPAYTFDIGSRPDPEWRTYFDFLHPSADDLQRIMNRRVLDNLSAHGDDLDQPREIDHLAYVPDQASLRSLRDYLMELAFTMEPPRFDDASIALTFRRVDPPRQINDLVIPLARRIAELGGEYDGWGCNVVTAQG